MLDAKLIRETPDVVRAAIAKNTMAKITPKLGGSTHFLIATDGAPGN